MSIEKIYVTHATNKSLDDRFGNIMQQPIRFTINPLPPNGYEWVMVRRSHGIIRGQIFPDRGFGNYRRIRFKRNQQVGNGRAPFRYNHYNANQGYNHINWKRRNNGGVRQKKGRQTFSNGNFNRMQRQNNSANLPSIQQLDQELDGYMAAGSSKTNFRIKLDRELDNYMNMTAGADDDPMEEL